MTPRLQRGQAAPSVQHWSSKNARKYKGTLDNAYLTTGPAGRDDVNVALKIPREV